MKKVLAIVLALAMVIVFAACAGNNGDDTTTTEAPVSTTEEASAEGTTEEASKKPVADGETFGQLLLADFKAEVASGDKTALQLAEALSQNENIQFMAMAMEVEEGFLNGFDADEIKGFESAATFAPAIGSIPFIGYVFTLAADADVDAFVTMLKDNANPRWNICVEAEEMVTGSAGNKVFFVMCPKSPEN